ncbi:MAG: glycosyltransferase family 2 protein [Elusimicrobia bacterium]|nr:glycosyltransferase family 2 protein [Elusimicrobiota bacterium]
MPVELSLAVCAFNEEKTLAAVLEALCALEIDREIIVVDDGSEDETHAIARRFGDRHPFVRVARHETRLGKGAALKTALNCAAGIYFAVQDADLEYDPRDIPRCLDEMKKRNLDVIFGSRFLKPNPTCYPLFLAGNKLVSLYISRLVGLKITDAYTGRKIFKTVSLRAAGIESSGFEVEAELAVKFGLKAAKGELVYGEIPIDYRPRTVAEGKKIKIADGLRAMASALYWRMKA